MGVRVNGSELRRQLAMRGLTGADLAAGAHLSAATVSHALSGRPISARTYRAITCVLEEVHASSELLLLP